MKVNWQSNAPSLELKVPSEVRVDGYIPTSEDLTFTTNTSSQFSGDVMAWVFNHYNVQINAKLIATYLFFRSNKIVDMSNTSIYFSASNATGIFSNCKGLKKPPKISGTISEWSRMFYACEKLEELPEDYFNNVKVKIDSYGNTMHSMFTYCYSLKKMPPLKPIYDSLTTLPRYYFYYSPFYGLFGDCRSLKIIDKLPIPEAYQTSNVTSNVFDTDSFSNTFSLSKLVFETVPSVKWSAQYIDLTSNVGFSKSNYYDKIAQLSSVYNHDSAVETINSLPDTSAYLATAGGTNTIKFIGNAGSATDGGAINTMTPEEIAVATAKGWTVTFA